MIWGGEGDKVFVQVHKGRRPSGAMLPDTEFGLRRVTVMSLVTFFILEGRSRLGECKRDLLFCVLPVKNISVAGAGT
jgi:hypothetical protein